MLAIRRHLPALALAAPALVLLALYSPLSVVVWLSDGLYSLAVVAAAAGCGAWPAGWLRPGKRGAAAQLCLATALGLGVLAIATLALGCGGWLGRFTAWGLVAGGCGAGVAYVRRSGGQDARAPQAGDAARPTREARGSSAGHPQSARAGVRPVLFALTLAVPLAVLLFGATLPPGVLWTDEARGYDVLEYHLQAPREYFESGRIRFLPHNVYASFPQQMEMLYLLLMHLTGDAHAAAIPAQMLHALCGGLAIVALVAFAPRSADRWLIAALAGATPWIAYSGCLAYVECGMLLFLAVAAGLLAQSLHLSDDNFVPYASGGHPAREILAAGLCAGLACGCKYTAIVLGAAGLGVATVAAMRGLAPARGRVAVYFALGVAIAFSPWAIRNLAFTGNPLYPFAYSVFGGRGWSAEQDAQWRRGHALAAENGGPLERLHVAGRELLGTVDARPPFLHPSLFGVALLPVGLASAALGRGRLRGMTAVWAAAIVATWAGLTHMPGRFAMPLLVPITMLVAHAAGRSRAALAALSAFVLAGGVFSSVQLLGMIRQEDDSWQRRVGAPLAALVDQTDLFVRKHPLNAALPPGSRVWMIGDAAVFYVQRAMHYTVVFGRDPWLEFARAQPDAGACVAWLHQRAFSHVCVSWPEVERLRRTYGFAEVVTPEWVGRLRSAGLSPVAAELPAGVELYAVP
ncbi:MAG: hypothetical protein HRF50_05620 [Phycisphaerae bacterium]|jgi:hypothetical protein